MKEETKECRDCRYYTQHYAKKAEDWFISVYCGHCNYPKRLIGKKHSPDDSCDYWEQNPETQKDTKEVLSYRLRHAIKQLYDILFILIHDYDKHV